MMSPPLVAAREPAADATTPRLLPRGQIEPILATILGAVLLPVCFYWLRFTWKWWRSSTPRSSLALIVLTMWIVMALDEGFIIAYAAAFDACTVPYYNATPPLSPALGACRAAFYFQATDQLQNLGACLMVIATTLRFAHVFAATSARRRARLARVLVATAVVVCAVRAVIIAAKQYVVDVENGSIDPATAQTVLDVDVASMNAAYLIYGMLDLVCLGMGARYIFRLRAEIQNDLAAPPAKQRGLRIPVPRLPSLKATTRRMRRTSSSTRGPTSGSATSAASMTVEKPAVPLLSPARTRRAPATGDPSAEIQVTTPAAPPPGSPASSRRATPLADASASASATRARLAQLVRQLRFRLALCVGMLLVFIASSALADAIPAVLLNTVTTACLKLFAAGDMLAMTGLKRILMAQRAARHTGATSGVSAGGGVGKTARPSVFGTSVSFAESGSVGSHPTAPTQHQDRVTVWPRRLHSSFSQGDQLTGTGETAG
ncbi:hypothetical protein AMAG_03783 [Allomyces macrogynus ATCC 38327]|uniref:Uncharacterized protein n=1 Tax=Allomyces macrogynus (strain ATCC 38327) TaxID=578462 RepID=A0A0L0SAQ5_ALLM3|nr:hypothetical protein AMAG_03783 [Allomyces macrogynus ATCC 38327]|eukprot:KNE59512.1 hypothetical protein AMAG_03783 [Allomyces macrogynus ATCC 38327]